MQRVALCDPLLELEHSLWRGLVVLSSSLDGLTGVAQVLHAVAQFLNEAFTGAGELQDLTDLSRVRDRSPVVEGELGDLKLAQGGGDSGADRERSKV